MTDLFIRPGVDPQPLPFDAHDETGRLWTDLANSAEGRKATGWNKPAPAQPSFDPATQALTWSGTAWVVSDLPPPAPDPTAGFIPVSLYRQRLEKLGMLDDFAAYLVQSPTLQLKVLTLENGLIDPAYPDILAAFDVLKVPQAYQDYLNARPILGVPDVPNL